MYNVNNYNNNNTKSLVYLFSFLIFETKFKLNFNSYVKCNNWRTKVGIYEINLYEVNNFDSFISYYKEISCEKLLEKYM